VHALQVAGTWYVKIYLHDEKQNRFNIQLEIQYSFQKHMKCQLIMSPYPLTLDTNKLCIALVVFSICQSILQWLVGAVVHFNVIIAISCHCIFLRHPHKSILQGSKHCCGYIYIICEDCLIIIQSLKYRELSCIWHSMLQKLLTKQNKHQTMTVQT